MTVVAIDWDQTLVDTRTQEWLPGAVDALHRLLSNSSVKVIIHSCRANSAAGAAAIRTKIQATLGAHDVRVEGKLTADIYIDDRAVRFAGWPTTLREIPLDQEAPARAPRRSRQVIEPSAAAILAGWGA